MSNEKKLKRNPGPKKEQEILRQQQEYNISNKRFVVESVFPTESDDTLGTTLLRLMGDDLFPPC